MKQWAVGGFALNYKTRTEVDFIAYVTAATIPEALEKAAKDILFPLPAGWTLEWSSVTYHEEEKEELFEGVE